MTVNKRNTACDPGKNFWPVILQDTTKDESTYFSAPTENERNVLYFRLRRGLKRDERLYIVDGMGEAHELGIQIRICGLTYDNPRNLKYLFADEYAAELHDEIFMEK